jgi:hypothetical protein
MIALAQKLGLLKRHAFGWRASSLASQYYDGLGFGVLRSAWQARYRQGFVQR